MIQHPVCFTRLTYVQVTSHHEDLLTQASNANSLSGTLLSIRSGLNDLDASVDKYGLRTIVLLHSSSFLQF